MRRRINRSKQRKAERKERADERALLLSSMSPLDQAKCMNRLKSSYDRRKHEEACILHLRCTEPFFKDHLP